MEKSTQLYTLNLQLWRGGAKIEISTNDKLMNDTDGKYKMFRNFMYNELGITKDDIERWAKQACFEVVEKRANNMNIDQVFREAAVKAAKEAIGGTSSWSEELRKTREAVAIEVAKQIKIELK